MEVAVRADAASSAAPTLSQQDIDRLLAQPQIQSFMAELKKAAPPTVTGELDQHAFFKDVEVKTKLLDVVVGAGLAYLVVGPYLVPTLANVLPIKLPGNLTQATIEAALAWAAFRWGRSNNIAKVTGFLFAADAARLVLTQFVPSINLGGSGGGGSVAQSQPTTQIALSRNTLAGV